MIKKNQLPAGTIRQLWIHRRLLWQFSLRNLELRHKGSLLGGIWTIVNPLLLLGIYVVVFGYIFGGHFPEDPINTKASYALTIFLGLAIFHYVAEVNAIAPTTIIGSPNLVKKVVFPLPILPVSAVAAATIHFLITLLLALGAAQLLGMPIWSKLGWLLFLTFPCVLLNLGVAFTLSSIGVFVKDIIQITQFLNLALLYSSAVFFSVTSIPEAFWRILKFNPYLQIINETRDVVFWNQSPSLPHVLYAYGVGAVTLAVGSFLFGKLRKGFSDAL